MSDEPAPNFCINGQWVYAPPGLEPIPPEEFPTTFLGKPVVIEGSLPPRKSSDFQVRLPVVEVELYADHPEPKTLFGLSIGLDRIKPRKKPKGRRKKR